ncbi:MAG: hypothetical protein ABI051_10260 [Vicinamibacterales bacterium]
MKSMRNVKTLAVLVIAMLVSAATTMRADSCVTPEGTLQSRPISADGLRSFSGTITPLGALTGVLRLSPNPDGSFTGEFALKAKGGVAYGTFEGQFTSASTYVERLTFTGGSGKYAGITGYAVVSGVLAPDGTATDTVVAGQICVR